MDQTLKFELKNLQTRRTRVRHCGCYVETPIVFLSFSSLLGVVVTTTKRGLNSIERLADSFTTDDKKEEIFFEIEMKFDLMFFSFSSLLTILYSTLITPMLKYI